MIFDIEAELHKTRIPDGRQEVELKEVVILLADPKQVKQRGGKLIDSGRVKQQGKDVTEKGPESSLDPWKLNSAGYVVPFLHRLLIVPGFF